jgi:serine/threonine-protein kinase
VFVADETQLGRKVVVKVLSPEIAQAMSTSRFEREIRVAASLQQANIVPVFAAGAVDGLPYYTMPFVEGESLRARLGRGPLSISEAVSILRDVSRALAYAHDHGVVHRDIKPDNVLLSGHTAVVTDFGIAKAIAAAAESPAGATLTQLGTAIGRRRTWRRSRAAVTLRPITVPTSTPSAASRTSCSPARRRSRFAGAQAAGGAHDGDAEAGRGASP